MKSRNLLFAAVLGSASFPLHGADVILDASDGFGASSFNSGLNWTGDAAPSTGNAYFTGDFVLRTPSNANNQTFAGDSLTINNTGAYPKGLFYKGTGTSATTGTITVNNLILDGGLISHGQGDTQFFNLAGNIAVVAPSTIWAKQGPTNIYSSISGSSNITVTIPDSNLASRVLTFHSGTSTFTGNLINNGRFTLADDAVFNFVIGADGVNNSISGTGSTTTFNGDFIFDLTDASSNKGDTWSLVTATGQSYGSTFSVAGFTDNLDNTWSKDIGSGLSYLFRESTGTLAVVASPKNLVWLGGGADPDAWDFNTTLNWQDEVPAAAKYFNGDNVSFTNAGLANPAVDVTAAVAPESVLVDSTGNYTFLGAGKITGNTGLTKVNSGQLTLATANDYTGDTSIQQGTLVLSGSLSNTVIQVGTDATLQTTSTGTISGTASLSVSGSATLANTTSYTGSTDVQSGATLQLGDGTTDGSIPSTSSIFNDGSIVFNNTLDQSVRAAISGLGSVSKQGAGNLSLTAANSYSGGTSITEGYLNLSGTGTLGSGNIAIASGAALNFGNAQTISVAVTGAGDINHNGGGQVAFTGDVSGFTGTYTHNSSVFSSVFNTSSATSAAAAYMIASTQGSIQGMIAAGNGDYTLQLGSLSGVANSLFRGGNFAIGTTTLEVGALGTDTTFSGIIADGTTKPIALTKVGAGTLTLEGLNTYTGNTTVTGGVLAIAQDDALNDTSTLTLASTASLNLTHSGTDIVGTLIINGETQGDGIYTFGNGKIQVGTSTPFQTWAISKGLDGTTNKENGPADDPDKDGSSNLAEFAFNGDPLSGLDNGQVYVLTADSDADSPDVTTKELILTLAVRKTTPAFTAGAPATALLTDGVNYSIHGSTDLASFGVTVTPVGFVDPGVALTDATNYEYRSFSLNGSNGLAGKGFLRAMAEAP